MKITYQTPGLQTSESQNTGCFNNRTVVIGFGIAAVAGTYMFSPVLALGLGLGLGVTAGLLYKRSLSDSLTSTPMDLASEKMKSRSSDVKRKGLQELSQVYQTADNDLQNSIIKLVFEAFKDHNSGQEDRLKSFEKEALGQIFAWSNSDTLDKAKLEIFIDGFTSYLNSRSKEDLQLTDGEFQRILSNTIDYVLKKFLEKHITTIKNEKIDLTPLKTSLASVFKNLPKDQYGDVVKQQLANVFQLIK